VNRLRFRADHSAEIADINFCERSGLIRQDASQYFITLLAVTELNSQEAVSFFSLAERVYSSLIRRYHGAPGAPVLINDLAAELQLEFVDAFRCVALMSECYLCSAGFSGAQSIETPQHAQIIPAESILCYPNFRSCIEQLQTLRSQYSANDVLTAFSFQTFQPTQPIFGGQSIRLKEALPENQAGLLVEVYVAIERKLLTLASMGLRAIIDMVCLEQVGDKGSFKEKLNALCKIEVISRKQTEVLLTVIDSGNASAHRGFTPDEVDIDTVLGVVEHLLSTVYVHPKGAAELAKKTPARSQKQP
jgi:hypothetical protein